MKDLVIYRGILMTREEAIEMRDNQERRRVGLEAAWLREYNCSEDPKQKSFHFKANKSFKSLL